MKVTDSLSCMKIIRNFNISKKLKSRAPTRMNFSIPSDLAEKFRSKCARDNVRMSQVVAELLEHFVRLP